MAKKNIKNWGRKALSLLLTLTMVTSLLQISAFAAPQNGRPAGGADTVTVVINGESTLVFKGDANDLSGQGGEDVYVDVEVTGSDEDGYKLNISIYGGRGVDGTKNDLGEDRTIADGADYNTSNGTVTYAVDLPSGYSYTTGKITEGIEADITTVNYSDSVKITINTNGPIIDVGTGEEEPEKSYSVVANYYTDGVQDNAEPVAIDSVEKVFNLPSTDEVEAAYSADHTEYNGNVYEYTSIELAGTVFILSYVRTTPAPSPVLSITKTADKSSGMVGDVINYTITVTNTGNADASGVTVVDAPDANLIVDTENLAGGEYAEGKITWTGISVAQGGEWSVTIPMTLTASEGDTEAVNAVAIEDGNGDEETVALLGKLEISKEASGAEVPAEASFTVSGPDGYSETVKYSEFVDGKYVLEDLPLGTYTVTEDEDSAQVSGYDLTVTGNGGEADVSATVSGMVTITNTYGKIVPPTGSLKITKTTSGNTTPAEAVFTVTGPESYEKTVTFAEFVDGVYEIRGLALGEYTVVESGADISGYDLAVTGTKVASIEAKGDVAEIELHNEYTKQSPKVGSLRIHKTAQGATVPAEATFTVIGEGYRTSVTYAEFDETGYYQITNLAPGKYTVTEVNAGISGYDLTVTGDKEATVVAGGTADLEIVNTYEQQTGYLTINKSTLGLANGLDIPATTKFDIVNYNARPGENPIVKTVYWSAFENGSITVELPVGEYTVVEDLDSAKVDGYGSPSRLAGYDNGEYAEVEKAATAVVSYTNTYKETYIPQSDLSIEKVADVGSAKVGDTITYTITVTNNGDASAKALVIEDTPDANLKIIGTDGGEYADGKITWKIGVLGKNGGSESFTVRAQVKATDALQVVNTATVTDEGGDTDSDTEIVYLDATLKIKKVFSGLDEQNLARVKRELVFTVTDPDGESKDYSFAEDFYRGELEIEDPIPGVYTVVEKNAEVDGYVLDNGEGVWEVEVEEGGSAETLTVTNKYTGKIYNIWFDAGNHGDVSRGSSHVISGLWRNRWVPFDDGEEVTYDWSGFGLKEGWKVYQLGTSDTNNLYPDLAENPVVAEDSSMILYHFSWADWMDYREDMGESKPNLKVEDGWKSDKEFYLDGGDTAFTSFEAAVEYMNANPDETIDANGFYNAYYVAKYENDPVDPPAPPSGGGGGGGGSKPDPRPTPDPVIEIPEEEVPLAPTPEEEPVVEIPEEEVPLAEVPKTGDKSVMFVLLALISGLGVAALQLTRKREEEELI